MSEPGEDAKPSDGTARPREDMPDSEELGNMSSLGIISLPNNVMVANTVDSPHKCSVHMFNI